jgi:hypothetical protein
MNVHDCTPPRHPQTEAESTRAAGPLQLISRVYFKFGLERTVLCKQRVEN